MGIKSRWVIRRRGPSPPLTKADQKDAAKTKTNVKRMVMEHPVVQQALEVLGGELVDIRNLRSNREG
jgi:DNA polymerase-3 subunit gamma/tau